MPTSRPEAPVLIVGAGITGIVAAIELLERGRCVVLLDRDIAGRLGGQARESFGGILAVDTPLQRRQGIQDNPGIALEDWTRFGELTPADGWPHRWAEAYVHECREAVYDWLRSLGVRFLPMPMWPEQAGNRLPRWHVVWGLGARLVEVLVARMHALAAGRLELRFSHRVERLVSEQGRVVGVAGAREDDGRPFEVRGRAVLVAAGGIGGDPEQVRALWPASLGPAPRELLVGAHRYCDGMLHEAGAAVGAQVRGMDRMWNYAAGVEHWNPPQPHYGLSLVPPRSALWLEPTGRRLDPPLLAGRDTRELVGRIARSGGSSWQVLNRRIALRELTVSGSEFNPAMRERRILAVARDLLLGNRWIVDTLVRHCPDVLVADTLEGLVARMNERARAAGETRAVSLAQVEQAVREFDAALAAGNASDAVSDDPQVAMILAARASRADRLRTARPAPLLRPGDGPLIAVRERILTRKSLGGILTDLEGQALDAQDRPIAGLYAAGEAAGFGGGGMNGIRALEGTFLGGCIHSGRRAGRALAVQESAGEGS